MHFASRALTSGQRRLHVHGWRGRGRGLRQRLRVAAAEAVQGDVQEAAPLAGVGVARGQDGLAEGAAEQDEVRNNIGDFHIPALARPVGADDRTALPIAGDDPEARVSAAELISRLGFDTVDVGPLADSWRFEPETDPYALPYFTDPDAAKAAFVQLAEALRAGAPLEMTSPDDPGAPLSAARLRALLADTPRKLTADRVIA